MLDTLANRSGLEGIGGSGRDLRDIEAAATAGNEKARLALDVFIASARHYLGAYLVELGGADAIVFTGGIGENSALIREGVCRDLGWFGIELDPTAQRLGTGRAGRLDARLAGPGLDRPDQRGDRRRPAGPRPPASLKNDDSAMRSESDQCSTSEIFESEIRSPPMFVARVTGSLVATQKVASMTGHKLLIVEPYRVDEKNRDRLVPTGRTFVAVDALGAGLDEMVLICQGSSARLTPETEKLPIDAVVIGLVDTVDVGGRTIFSTRDGIDANPHTPDPPNADGDRPWK